MNDIRVFPDTNALVSMLCFPRPQHGRLPLAHEVADAEAAGECSLLIAEVVAAELREVTFHTPAMQRFLETHDFVPVTLFGLLKLLGRR